MKDLSMSREKNNSTDLTPAPRSFPATRSIPSPEKVQAEHREVDVVDLYAAATASFQARLDWIEHQGQRDSPDWHLTNGLLRLAQGLQQDHEAQEERLKSFARSWSPPHRN